MANKGQTPVNLYVYDKDQGKWIPLTFDKSVNDVIVTTSYNRPDIFVGTVTISSAGTPVQGPSVQIPAGFALAFIGRSSNTGNCFVAHSQANASVSGNRATLTPGGPGGRAFITNANLLWFDAATSGDIVELLVER